VLVLEAFTVVLMLVLLFVVVWTLAATVEDSPAVSVDVEVEFVIT